MGDSLTPNPSKSDRFLSIIIGITAEEIRSFCFLKNRIGELFKNEDIFIIMEAYT